MQQESIAKKVSRFKFCNERFYPYIEKVLIRLPEEICFESVLDDLNFEIISFGEALGRFYPLRTQVKNLIILNEDILKQPEFQIIYTIVHGIAHKIIGKGESELYEREAEELLVRWDFQEEVEKANYAKAWLEDGGYEIGYKWAAKQSDLGKFEEFYDEWEQGKLDEQGWYELFYRANIDSIIAEMDTEVIKSEEKLVQTGPKAIQNDDSYNQSIVSGIMGFLKKKKHDMLKSLNKSDLSESERDALFWITLKEAFLSCEKLFDQRIYLVTRQYIEKYPEIDAFQNALIKVGTLLEE